MGSIDSKQFPQVPFPASYASEFRTYFDSDVYRQIEEHVKANTSHEVGGILVGRWQKDENGPYVAVTAMIRCDKAVGKEGEVTFTHETWNDISREMDGPYADFQIVGWYHSHPGFGVFLSERDLFIQEHFFSNPGQIALVIDPMSETEGVFFWKKDKVVVGEHFWVGQKMRWSQTDNADPARHPKVKQPVPAESNVAGRAGSASCGNDSLLLGNFWFSALVLVTLCMVMFVLGGYFKPTDELDRQERLLEGAIFDYCLASNKRPGLEYFLVQIDRDLQQAMSEVTKLREGEPKSGKDAGKDAGKGVDKDRRVSKNAEPIAPERLAVLTNHLIRSKEQVGQVYSLYCLSEKDKQALVELIGQSIQSTLVKSEAVPKKEEKKQDKEPVKDKGNKKKS